MNSLVFCLMGPTASGKTALSFELVERFPFEIISIDSAMIYRGLDIGTAKPTEALLSLIPHHLIDCLDPPESYSAAMCCEDVLRISDEMISRGKIPLLVGGTMMYFNALQQGLSVLPEANPAIRATLLALAEERGWDYLYTWLSKVDPVAAKRIHPHDKQRIQRALEVFQITGHPLTACLEAKMPCRLSFINMILVPEDRALLHARIASRFQEMIAQGLIDEVAHLLDQWPLTPASPSMRSVGYRQVLAYLQGEDSQSMMTEKGIYATRQLAKRQLTWLRSWPNGNYFIAEHTNLVAEVVEFIQQILDNNGSKPA